MIDPSWDCKVCGGGKRANVEKHDPSTGVVLERLFGLKPFEVNEKTALGFLVSEVFCGSCGLMYHCDAI